MAAYGEYARHRDSGGSRRRPRDAPTQFQHHQQQQIQHQYIQQNQHQQPQRGPQKRRDTADSDRSRGALTSSHASSQGTAAKRPRVRFAPSLDAPLLSKVATMSGFLRKQADNEPGKWIKYYFVLKPTTLLYYYASERDPEPRGILDVEFLRDVRFNADCVQRSVGGGKHAFRITGQLPAALCAAGADPNKTQFRPVYLDAESRDQADAWMEAIRHHRFDLARHRDYDDLLDSMDEVEERLGVLRAQGAELAAAANRVRRKGRELVCALRGVEPDEPAVEDAATRPRGLSAAPGSADEDVAATLQAIGALLDELFAEADRHRRVTELLREREGDAARENGQLKECEAELAIQTTRSERLERELALLREDQHQQKQSYETRYEELVARERHLLAREKEMLAQIKERERLCDARMQEVDQKSSKWSKELEKEAARRNLELEKRRKALDKQQKALEQKQKQLDKRLQDTAPPSKMRFVGAIGKSRATPVEEPVDHHGDEKQHLDQYQYDEDDEMVVSRPGAKGRGRFMPSFLSRKGTASGAHHETESSEDAEPALPARRARAAPEPEIESDYFDARADLPSREYHTSSRGAGDGTQYSPDRSSDASTTRLSGVSYSSSVSTQYATQPRSGRSFTTGAIAPAAKRPVPARSASIPAATSATSAVYNGMTVRLPPEWTYKESKKYMGRFYYYNRISGETRWEFPFDAVLDDEPAAAARVSHASSYDDGNDFVSASQDEREDISSFLTRTRAMTQQRAATRGGALSTRSRAQSSAHASTSWENQYYSESAMAARMGFVPEEPEGDDSMHPIEEEISASSGKARGWGSKLPKIRAKSSGTSNHQDEADDAGAAPAKTGKGWKLMPKVPFGKGARAKAVAAAAAAPVSPEASDPIVHDDGRHEF